MATLKIEICHPKPGENEHTPSIAPKELFIATGQAVNRAKIFNAVGVLRPLQGGQGSVTGETIAFTREVRHPNGRTSLRRRPRWVIMFDLTDIDTGTEYILSVTGVDQNGDPVDDATAERHVVVRSITGPFIDISYPPNRHRLSEEESACFVAYGTFSGTGHDAVSAVMNEVQPDYLYSENSFWSAVFPPLDEGTYTLTVVDAANHSAAKDGLEVG